MKVTVNKGGKTATDENGETHIINGLDLHKYFHDVNSRFFKVACPENTIHAASKLKNGRINLH